MSEIQRYAVIETKTGRVVNIIVWDGKTAWKPDEGFEARLATDKDDADFSNPSSSKE